MRPWEAGNAQYVKRQDYEFGGMVTAAPMSGDWFHQHFGASKDPFRLTAWFGPHNPGREPGPPGEKHTDYTGMDIPEGGSAIPYWMEDPFKTSTGHPFHLRLESSLQSKRLVHVWMKHMQVTRELFYCPRCQYFLKQCSTG